MYTYLMKEDNLKNKYQNFNRGYHQNMRLRFFFHFVFVLEAIILVYYL